MAAQLVSLTLLGFSPFGAVAQAITAEQPTLKNLAVALRLHGITDLSEESLTSELNNSDPEVRNLAANKLAEDHYSQSAPAIESALSREKNIDTQIGFAEALWVLHDAKGVAYLQSMCADPSLSVEATTAAVRALYITRSSGVGCAERLLDQMNHLRDPGEVGAVASLLPSMYRDATPVEAKRIVYALQTLLLNQKQQVTVRMRAGLALAQIGSPEASQSIRTAISREADPAMRSFLEGNLKSQQERP